MDELHLAQEFSLLALNAQDSLHMTTVKKIALRCVAAAVVLELYLDGEFIAQPEGGLTMRESLLERPGTALYQQVVLKAFLAKTPDARGDLRWWLTKASGISGAQRKKLEKAVGDSLKDQHLLDEIPNLLGCDLLYDTAGVSIREYRAEPAAYTRIAEATRAELLEDGTANDEAVCLLWLLRESGCMHDLFSKAELGVIAEKMEALLNALPLAKTLFAIDVHRGAELGVKGFLNAKKAVFSTQTGTGVNFAFPILERSQSVFVDVEAAFSGAAQRLADVRARLEARGHQFTVLREGAVPLIRIDNIVYEAIPTAVTVGKIPVQGMRLRKYPG